MRAMPSPRYSAFVDQMLLKATEVTVDRRQRCSTPPRRTFDSFIALSDTAYEVMLVEIEKRASRAGDQPQSHGARSSRW